MVARQFDLCANTDPSERRRVPFMLVLQSDYLPELKSVVVAPVLKLIKGMQVDKLNPTIVVEDERYFVLVQAMAAVSPRILGKLKHNFSSQRDEFIRAIDILFTGY